jgi:hypothetical protein
VNPPFAFPDFTLQQGNINDSLSCFGIETFHDAVEWIWKLPYGRNTDRTNYLLVPKEQRGACSTKHAFLAALAQEQGVDLKLMVGIFLMDGINTPKISDILAQANLSALPEAHCYLRFGERRYDFTHFDQGSASCRMALEILHEEEISPEQIGDHKISLHKKWIGHWLAQSPNLKMSSEKIWKIRETCIEGLSES